MQVRYLVLAIIGAMVLSVGAVACSDDDDNGDGGNGGGETLSLDAYFEQVKGIMDGMDEGGVVIETKLDEEIEAATEANDIGGILIAFADGMDEFQGLAATTADDLGAIDPPSEVENQHRELTAMFNVVTSALDDLKNAAEEIDPDADPDVIIEDITDLGTDIQTELGSLGTQGEVLCFEMQGIADENDIDIDLECGD